MKEPIWLMDEAVLALHEQLIVAFGGSHGLRDAGMLSSALARPRNAFAYATPNLHELAAGYAFGLV